MRSTALHTHGAGWAPDSRAGRWSVTLAGLALGGTILLAVAFALGLEPADSFSDDWLLTGAGATILACGAAAVVTGAIAVVRRHDYSLLVAAAVGLGLVPVVLMLQQVAEGLGWLGS